MPERSRDTDERAPVRLDPPDESEEQDALVDEMERESFPASDPPSSWAGPDD